MRHREHATPTQRVGSVLAFVESAGLGLLCALHFGATFQLGDTTIGAGFLYPAGIVEGLLALALLLAVALPADGSVRAGRVLGAQVLTVLGLFVLQVALVRGGLFELRGAAPYAACLIVSLASLALLASPIARSGSAGPRSAREGESIARQPPVIP
jgi:hypothetical protein